jgi:hypothetical protein
MARDKIINRSSANSDHLLFRLADPPICRRDAVANLLTAELVKLIGVQKKLEFLETQIAEDRTRLICLRAQFDDAGLDTRGKLTTGEKLLRTIDRVQQTLDQSCDQLRWKARN